MESDFNEGDECLKMMSEMSRENLRLSLESQLEPSRA
jgi:hypothetical protein